jgi:hypothetical protein
MLRSATQEMNPPPVLMNSPPVLVNPPCAAIQIDAEERHSGARAIRAAVCEAVVQSKEQSERNLEGGTRRLYVTVT